MKDFLIDVDEVLADFVNPAAEIISKLQGRTWTLDDAPTDNWDMFSNLEPDVLKGVFEAMNGQGFVAKLQPTPGSQDFVRELRKKCNVYALTAPHHTSAWWVLERNIWLGDLFGIDRKHVVHTDAKYLCRGDFFLDDRHDHVTRWIARHPDKSGLWWGTKHNQRLLKSGLELPTHLRVSAWDEVLQRVGV